MKKIPTLFVREHDGNRLVRDEVTPGAEWVVAGEGVATQKHDGTCCLVRGGRLFKRYDAKLGRIPPLIFEPAQPEPDPVTGHWPGWLQIGGAPDDRWHERALGTWLSTHNQDSPADGTYELVGPQINGNPESVGDPQLIKHGWPWPESVPRTFQALKDYLADLDIEGFVFHHPDGRMVKIKKRDFGLVRTPYWKV